MKTVLVLKNLLQRRPRLLSDHVKELRSQVVPPDLLRGRPRHHFSISKLIPIPIFISFVLAVALVVLVGLLPTFSGFDHILSCIGQQQVNQIEGTIAASAQVLAAISGFVLPLIILFVEFYGRTVSSVLGRYLKGTGLLPVMYWSLAVAALDILMIGVVQLGLISSVHIAAALLFVLVALTTGVIIEVALVMRRTVSVASVETLPSILQNALDELVLRGFEEELDYRLGRLLFIKLLDQLQAGRVSPLQPQPNGMTAVTAAKEGLLKDVDLEELEKLIETVREAIGDRQESPLLLFDKLPGDFIRQGEIIAYVPPLADSRALPERLGRCLAIKPGIKQTEDPRLFLDQLKDLTVNAAEQHAQSRFESLFELYSRALELNAQLIEPPPVSEWDFFREWWVITMVRTALYDVLKVAAKSGYCAHCCYRLHAAARYAASKRNVKAFRLILEFFEYIYLYSREATDEDGVNASFNYLSRNLVDHVLEVRRPVMEYTLERASQTQAMLNSIFEAMFNILYRTIKERDLSTYQRLLGRLQVPELFAYYSLRRDLLNRRHELESILRTGRPTGGDDTDMLLELEAVDQLLQLPRQSQEVLAQWRLIVGSYLLRSYTMGTLSIELLRQFLEPLESVFNDLRAMVLVLERMFKVPDLPGRWSRFEGFPDTRQAVSYDPRVDQLLFYCVMGTRLLSQSDDTPPVPKVEFVGNHLSTIQRICDDIQDNMSVWAPLIGVDDTGLAINQFLDFNREIVRNWRRLQEDRIIASLLNPERVNEYTRVLLEAWHNQAGIRSLLAGFKKSEVVDRVKGHGQVLRIYERSSKDAFVTERGNGLAQDEGHLDGSRLAHDESNWVVQMLLSRARVVPTRKDWFSLQPYFERGLQRLRDDGFEPSIIFIPQGCDYRLLESLPDFIPEYARQHQYRLSSLRGFFECIPIAAWQIAPWVLIVDLRMACELRVQHPKIEVRTPNEQEIASLREKQPEIDDRQLALSVVRQVKAKFKLRIAEPKALAKLRLKSGIPLRELDDGWVVGSNE